VRKSSGSIFLLVIILVVVAVLIVVGAFVFKSSQSKLTLPVSKNIKSPFSNIKFNTNNKEKDVALKAVKDMQKTLECQYNIDKKYPDSLIALLDLKNKCTLPEEFVLPKIMGDNWDSVNYTSTNNGQGYRFEMTVVPGEGYGVTENKTEYVVIPKTVQVDLLSKARDSQRDFDLDSLSKYIDLASVQSSDLAKFLCNGESTCVGDSRLTNSTKTDGTGWIKVNFASTGNIHFDSLALDPVNTDSNHYLYCADSSGWEIVGVLESKDNSKKMSSDGGIDSLKYEIGTNLYLLDALPNCKY